jgi:hypothetical protein
MRVVRTLRLCYLSQNGRGGELKMKAVQLTDGERVPVLGQGTWRMGENKSAQADEVAALRYKKILTANQSPVFIGA